jgi:hypothetical protein
VADIVLLTKTQAPLAIKTREESITSTEKFEEFGFAGMCHHPATRQAKRQFLSENSSTNRPPTTP